MQLSWGSGTPGDEPGSSSWCFFTTAKSSMMLTVAFGGEQRQLVGLLFGQAGVLDLDEILLAQRAGFQVETDGDALLGFDQLEQLEDLDALAGGDVVDDGAVTDGFDLQLVLLDMIYPFP